MVFIQPITFQGDGELLLNIQLASYWLLYNAAGAGNDLSYSLYNEDGSQWEIGTGQLSVGGAFTRDTVADSSNAGSIVEFNYGTHWVSIWTSSAGGASNTTVTPPQITSQQDDYTPTGWGDCRTIRIFSDGPYSITGLGALDDGVERVVLNVGSYDFTLTDSDTDSLAANRLNMGSDIVLPPRHAVIIRYDGSFVNWTCIARPYASGSASADVETITITFDGGGSALEVGAYAFWEAPVDGECAQWTMKLDGSTTDDVRIDVQKGTYASPPASTSDSICGGSGNQPQTSGANKATDATLSGWTTTFSAGDIFRFELMDATDAVKALLSLRYTEN